MSEPTHVTLEIRCPERHLLATAKLPKALVEPDQPPVHFAVRCTRCRVDVESVFLPPAEAPDGAPVKVWRRQKRQEFQVRCPDRGHHLLGRISIPVKHLSGGTPAILFHARCRACKITAEATFAGALPIDGLAPAASSESPVLPGEIQAVCDTT